MPSEPEAPRSSHGNQGQSWFKSLPLQYKAWTITCAVLGLMSLVLAGGVYQALQNSFTRLENQAVSENSTRIERGLAQYTDVLERSARDYANWNDSFDFVEQPSHSYIQANLNNSVLGNLQLDAFLVFDTKAELVALRSSDKLILGGAPDARSWQEGLSSIVRESLRDDGRSVKGITLLHGKLTLFACVPIHHDEGAGPVGGAILHLRYLDDRTITALKALTLLELSLEKPSTEPTRGSVASPGSRTRADLRQSTAKDLIEWLNFEVPLIDHFGQRIGLIYARMDRHIVHQGRESRTLLITGTLLICLISGVLIVWLLRILVIGRIESLSDEVRHIGRSASIHNRLHVEGSDEISVLATEINEMLTDLAEAEELQGAADAEKEKLQNQLLHAQKMEAIGTMAGGLAHDFNNMLNSILGSADLLRYELPQNHAAQEHIRRIEKAGVNAAGLVRQLLAVSRRQQLKSEAIHLRSMLSDAIRLVQAALPRSIQIRFESSTDEDSVLADSSQLHQVIMNLATNAAHAVAGREQGLIIIRLSKINLPDSARPETLKLAPGEYLRIEVSDNGCGIPPENLDRIFEPFFTTKPTGAGSGLGLAVVHGIIGKHNGCIGVSSILDKGTTFLLHLPCHAAASAATLTGTGHIDIYERSLNLLLVDDDRMVRDTLAAGLRRLGHVVHGTSSSEEALGLLADSSISLDAMITDQMMPGMSGTELGTHARDLRPELTMVLISGYATSVDEDLTKARGFVRVLMKPVTAAQLIEAATTVSKGPVKHP